MHIDLSDKRTLVTGASRGIGEAIAIQLVKSGATVAAHYNKNPVKTDHLTYEQLKKLVPIKADLSSPSETSALFDKVIDRFGHLDVIINNAGIAIKSSMEGDINHFVNDWKNTMDVNLLATGILCKHAINHFVGRNGGIIINISSRAAFRGDTPDYLAYAASKGGIVALTRSIARAYGKQGIVAFNVAPGFVKTDMAQDAIDAYGEGFVKDDIALNDLTQPQDLAPLITLLASGLANHATGGTFDINAGSYVH
ncbi:MAG: SDR family oxidoreductase [Bacteroidota bacterium]